MPSAPTSRCWRVEVLDRALGFAETQLEHAERLDGPHLVQPRPEAITELQRLGDVGPALGVASPAGLEAREPREPEHEVRLLAGLAREADRLQVGGLGHRPAVGGGVVERDQVEDERQRPDRRAFPRDLERAVEQRAPGAGLAEEDRRDRQPWNQLQVVAQFGRCTREGDRLLDRLRAGGGVAADDAGHPDRDRGQEPRAHRRAVRHQARGSLGDHQHLGRIAGVEAGAGGLGQHRDRTFWIGVLGGGGEDRVTSHHGSLAGRDVAGQLVDFEQAYALAGGCAGLVQQRHRPGHGPGVPALPGGGEHQPGAALAVGRQPPGTFERERGGRVRASIAGADPGLLERGRRLLVDARGGRGQVPGAAVDVAVGQRGRQRPVHRPALLGARAGVDRRARQRMAELDRAGPHRHEPGALGGRQRGKLDAQPPCRAFQQCEVAAVAGGQRAAAPAARPRRAHPSGAGTRGRSAPRRGPGLPLVRARARRRRGRARAARADCRRWRRAAGRRRPARASPAATRLPRG